MYIDIFVATEVLTDVFCLARKRWEKGKKTTTGNNNIYNNQNEDSNHFFRLNSSTSTV